MESRSTQTGHMGSVDNADNVVMPSAHPTAMPAADSTQMGSMGSANFRNEAVWPSAQPTATPAAGTTLTRPSVLTEDEQMAKAIRLSIEDNASATQNSHGPGKAVRSYQKFGDRSINMILAMNNALTLIHDPNGDTAIYIGPPRQEPEQTDKEYEFIKGHLTRVHVFQSQTLLSIGEESKFSTAHLLNPTSSFRAERRLRKLGVLAQAEAKHGGKFRYYIDLRPPTEDDEAVILITDLSCTRGVLTWHAATKKYLLDPLTVGGRDDFGTSSLLEQEGPVSPIPEPEVGNSAESFTHTSHDATAPPQKPLKAEPEQVETAPEYSILRHHLAVERLLQALHGNDPKLDSAPKLWTFFAIARYFGCASHERVAGWITAWLYAGDNANFIQNNPEVAYRVGMGIRSAVLVQDSFSILVGERALIEAYSEYRPVILHPLRKNVHGRKLEMLDDDERNRIDHAASALVKRVRETVVAKLCSEMEFLQSTTGYAQILNFKPEDANEDAIKKRAEETVRDYVRSRIYYVLCQDQKPMNSILEQDLTSTLSFRSATDAKFSDVYMDLNQPMRLFTKTFWHALSRTTFTSASGSLSNIGTTGLDYDTRYTEGLKAMYAKDRINGIVYISRNEFDNVIKAVNQIICARQANASASNNGNELLTSEPGPAVQNAEMNDSDARLIVDPVAQFKDDDADRTNEPLLAESSGSNSRFPMEEDTPPTKRRRTNEPVDSASSSGNDWRKDNISELSTANEALSTGLRVRYPDFSLHSNVHELTPRPKPQQPDFTTTGTYKNFVDKMTGPFSKVFGDYQARRNTKEDIENQGPLDKQPESSSEVPSFTGPRGESSANPNTYYTNRYYNPHTGKWHDSDIKFDLRNTAGSSSGRPKQHFSNSNTNINDQMQSSNLSTTGLYESNWAPTVPSKPEQNHDTQWREQLDSTSTFNPRLPSQKALPPMFGESEVDFFPINPGYILHQVQESLSNISAQMLQPLHLFHETGLLPTNLFDTLLCLTANEFRYLPLWCPDGNDDGSGGVFDEMPVPNLDEGSAGIESFGPGRIRRAHDDQDSEMSGSDIDEIQNSEVVSTVGRASKLATDGTVTIKSLASQSSAASVFGGAGTVLVDDNDALPDVEVGEDARGGVDDEEAFVDFDDTDNADSDTDNADSDTDTLNGDNHEISASLQDFVAASSSSAADKDAENGMPGPSTTISASAVDKGKGRATEDDLNSESRENINLPYRPLNTGAGKSSQMKGKEPESDDDYEFL